MGFMSRPACGHSLAKCRFDVAQPATSLAFNHQTTVMEQCRAVVGVAVHIVRSGH
jgi:hypothetical protein